MDRNKKGSRLLDRYKGVGELKKESKKQAGKLNRENAR